MAAVEELQHLLNGHESGYCDWARYPEGWGSAMGRQCEYVLFGRSGSAAISCRALITTRAGAGLLALTATAVLHYLSGG